MNALYRHSLQRWVREDRKIGGMQQAVFRAEAAVLLEEHVRWQTSGDRDATKPSITEDLITRAAAMGYTVSLFLDELDKVGNTPFKQNTLFSLLDAVYRAEGQIVVTSNTSPIGLGEQLGPSTAVALLRRIGADPGITMFFGGTLDETFD